MSEPLKISDALLRSRLVKTPIQGDRVVEGYLSGAIPTRGVSHPHSLKRHKLLDGFGPCGERSRLKRERDRRASKSRKRQRGGDAILPNNLRDWFTEGGRAVMSVIAGECRRIGRCEMPVEKIAAIAGVSIRTVQYTLAMASGKGLPPGSAALADDPLAPPVLIRVEYRPLKGRRNRTNVITIISREWLLWLSYKPAQRLPSTGCNEVHSTKNRNNNNPLVKGKISSEAIKGCAGGQPARGFGEGEGGKCSER